jgi:hypothetical protein
LITEGVGLFRAERISFTPFAMFGVIANAAKNRFIL